MQSNQGQGQDSFRSVVMGYLKRLSELSCLAEPFDYHVDMLWALLDRYTKDEDHERWERETENMDYKSSMTKIRIISLILYKAGVLPTRNIRKRQFPIDVKGERVGIKGGMTSHIKEDLGFTDILFNHMHLLSFLTKKGMDTTIHIDVLWFILSPYVTEEDYYKWRKNNDTFGNPDSPKYKPYLWNIEKVRIEMGVMDRADFLWRSTIVDAPEEYVSKGGDINIRSSIKRD